MCVRVCRWALLLLAFVACTRSSYMELDDHTKSTLHRLYVSYFFERQEDLWAEGAMRKLPALKAASGRWQTRLIACLLVCMLPPAPASLTFALRQRPTRRHAGVR